MCLNGLDDSTDDSTQHSCDSEEQQDRSRMGWNGKGGNVAKRSPLPPGLFANRIDVRDARVLQFTIDLSTELPGRPSGPPNSHGNAPRRNSNRTEPRLGSLSRSSLAQMDIASASQTQEMTETLPLLLSTVLPLDDLSAHRETFRKAAVYLAVQLRRGSDVVAGPLLSELFAPVDHTPRDLSPVRGLKVETRLRHEKISETTSSSVLQSIARHWKQILEWGRGRRVRGLSAVSRVPAESVDPFHADDTDVTKPVRMTHLYQYLSPVWPHALSHHGILSLLRKCGFAPLSYDVTALSKSCRPQRHDGDGGATMAEVMEEGLLKVIQLMDLHEDGVIDEGEFILCFACPTVVAQLLSTCKRSEVYYRNAPSGSLLHVGTDDSPPTAQHRALPWLPAASAAQRTLLDRSFHFYADHARILPAVPPARSLDASSLSRAPRRGRHSQRVLTFAAFLRTMRFLVAVVECARIGDMWQWLNEEGCTWMLRRGAGEGSRGTKDEEEGEERKKMEKKRYYDSPSPGTRSMLDAASRFTWLDDTQLDALTHSYCRYLFRTYGTSGECPGGECTTEQSPPRRTSETAHSHVTVHPSSLRKPSRTQSSKKMGAGEEERWPFRGRKEEPAARRTVPSEHTLHRKSTATPLGSPRHLTVDQFYQMCRHEPFILYAPHMAVREAALEIAQYVTHIP